jgi:TolA-binding protein
MMRRLITTSLLLLLVSGCASTADGAAEPAAPTAQTSAPASAAPSKPARLGTEEAAVLYLEAVRPYNEALEELETAINTGQPVEVQQERAAATLTALGAEIKALRAARWPAEVEPHALRLADAGEHAVPSWEAAAAATTSEAMVTAVMGALEHDDQAAADAIRRLLSLDQYDEGDYSS